METLGSSTVPLGFLVSLSRGQTLGAFEAIQMGKAAALLDVCRQIAEKMKFAPGVDTDQGCYWVMSGGECIEATGAAAVEEGAATQSRIAD